MVPHLVTALTGPINELEARVLESMPATERWFRLEWMEHTPPLRLGGRAQRRLQAGAGGHQPLPQRLQPADPQMLPQAVGAGRDGGHRRSARGAQSGRSAGCAAVQPEAGPPGPLARVFTQAGLNVRLGTFDPSVTAATTLTLPEGGEMTLEPMVRRKGRLVLQSGFDPAPSCSTPTWPAAFRRCCVA